MNIHNRFAIGIELHDSLPKRLKAIPVLRFQQAIALAYSGRLDEALSIIAEIGGLEIPDTREARNPSSIAEPYVQSGVSKQNATDRRLTQKFLFRANLMIEWIIQQAAGRL